MRRHPYGTMAVGSTVLALVLVVAFVVPSLRHQIAISVVRQPDRYIELAFTNPLNLPEAEPADQRVSFQFDLVAHGGLPTRTSYTVALSVPGEAPLVEQGTAVTPRQIRVTVDSSFRVPAAGDSYTVEVALPEFHQYVAFHGRATSPVPSSPTTPVPVATTTAVFRPTVGPVPSTVEYVRRVVHGWNFRMLSGVGT